MINTRSDKTVSAWNEKNIHNIMISNSTSACFFAALGLLMLWNVFTSGKKPERLIHEALVSDWYKFRRSSNPEVDNPKEYKKFKLRWNDTFIMVDGIPKPVFSKLGFQ